MTAEIPRQDLTRARLLAAAGEVFAERGFAAANVKEITGRAGINVASVNYYFRDKLGLYTEVLRSALPRPDAAEAATCAAEPPEKQLERFITRYVQTLLGEGRPSWCGRLMAWELAAPTEALTQVIEDVMRPNYLQLRKILATLLGSTMESEETRLAAHSVIAQCVHWVHAQPILPHLWPKLRLRTRRQIARIAQHISVFSLGGIRALQAARQPQRRRASRRLARL